MDLYKIHNLEGPSYGSLTNAKSLRIFLRGGGVRLRSITTKFGLVFGNMGWLWFSVTIRMVISAEKFWFIRVILVHMICINIFNINLVEFFRWGKQKLVYWSFIILDRSIPSNTFFEVL